MKLAHLWTELRLALAALLVGLIVGALTGYWAVSIAVALLIAIVFQLVNIVRLRAWLLKDAPIDRTPHLSGAADQIVSEICAIKKENTLQQERLEEILRRFDAATRAMPDAMLIVNEQQTIDWANPAAQTLLGIDVQRDIGQRIDNIVRDPEITAYLVGNNFSQPLEFSSARNEENDLMLRVIPYEEGFKLLIVHDHQDLLRLQQVRKSFISNASHEMRTPLTVIIGYLEALTLREETEKNLNRGIEGALDQAYRLKQLIEDLLSLSRLESLPLSKSQITQVDISALVGESVDLVKASKLHEGHKFELRLDDNAYIRGDARELQSAVQNIIENAVKYSPADSSIEIKWLTIPENKFALSVHNRSEPIERGHLIRLTERFYRLDSGRSRDKGGTGLGLSIVKHVMERHEGELTINSDKSSGTTVQLIFPSERVSMGLSQVSAR